MPVLRGQYILNKYEKETLVQVVSSIRQEFWGDKDTLIYGCFGIGQFNEVSAFLLEIAPELEVWKEMGEFGDEIWCRRRQQ